MINVYRYRSWRFISTYKPTMREVSDLQAAKNLGDKMSVEQSAAFNNLIHRGVVTGDPRTPDRPGINTKKIKRKPPSKGVRRRPDTVVTRNQSTLKGFVTYLPVGAKDPVTKNIEVLQTEGYTYDLKTHMLTPQFTTKIFPGYVPFTWLQPKAYTRVIRKKSITSATYEHPEAVSDFNVGSGSLNSSLTDTSWVHTGVDPIARAAAVLSFHSDLAGSKVDIMTTLVQTKSTLSTVANAGNDFLAMFSASRDKKYAQLNTILASRGKRKLSPKRQRKLNSLAPDKRWLELQYGWKPLIGDIRTALEEMANNKAKPVLLVARGIASYSPSRSNLSAEIISGLGTEKLKCYYLLKDDGSLRKAAQWNLGSNLLLTAWELVPYSFVLDWFVPFGDLFTQVSSSKGLHFVSGTRTRWLNATSTFKSVQRVSVSPVWVDIHRVIREETFYMQRDVLTSTPFTYIPPISWDLSTTRFISAVALITARRK